MVSAACFAGLLLSSSLEDADKLFTFAEPRTPEIETHLSKERRRVKQFIDWLLAQRAALRKPKRLPNVWNVKA